MYGNRYRSVSGKNASAWVSLNDNELLNIRAFLWRLMQALCEMLYIKEWLDLKEPFPPY